MLKTLVTALAAAAVLSIGVAPAFAGSSATPIVTPPNTGTAIGIATITCMMYPRPGCPR
jgi:hypothetical protein